MKFSQYLQKSKEKRTMAQVGIVMGSDSDMQIHSGTQFRNERLSKMR